MSATDWNTEVYGQAALEDRSAARLRVNIPATLRPSGERSFKTVVVDLSLGGFCANALQPMRPGNRCWLTLPGMESLQADVVWWDAGRVGCAFANLLRAVFDQSGSYPHELK
ncbi:MAG: pilus assembly protein PilZ [Novosphingobium sp. 16-62-11]|uniref:PilZ domain-containing protein n=1 Tax=Novosphingobium sp. 17-62-19 TaxID=1970406 RepID=UPI000BD68644|nr:PilZ domain-containing protein [Novosphingobium sp. 17-62-19]OYZ40088.1 MAG: pilus assembly protein PilZ [Novosphingobium sp. 16-62-11]OZA18527.1 MAG: pilus assembly protein PilZ [Novosphingobium sp. 17-62-19]HQS97508.1 PilZ domain-containing protein [Novosphingobium sp.]